MPLPIPFRTLAGRAAFRPQRRSAGEWSQPPSRQELTKSGSLPLTDIPLLPEVLECIVHALEDLGCRLGDERARRAPACPDYVDFLPPLERVVQLALDAAGEGGLAARQLGHEA